MSAESFLAFVLIQIRLCLWHYNPLLTHYNCIIQNRLQTDAELPVNAKANQFESYGSYPLKVSKYAMHACQTFLKFYSLSGVDRFYICYFW